MLVHSMINILRKLEKSSNKITTEVIAEAKQDPNVAVGIQARRTTNGVSISKYDIIAEKKSIGGGLQKNLYQIVNNKTNQIVYSDLGLFESAMGIVKHLLYTNKASRVNQILEFDAAYVGLIREAYSHKSRIQQLDEGSIQYDVASAKYGNSITKLNSIKSKIMSAI